MIYKCQEPGTWFAADPLALKVGAALSTLSSLMESSIKASSNIGSNSSAPVYSIAHGHVVHQCHIWRWPCSSIGRAGASEAPGSRFES